jgi:hypothetical protein
LEKFIAELSSKSPQVDVAFSKTAPLFMQQKGARRYLHTESGETKRLERQIASLPVVADEWRSKSKDDINVWVFSPNVFPSLRVERTV